MVASPLLSTAVSLGADLSVVPGESPDKYRNFPEFVKYARMRARASSERNGYNEFSRWCELAAWGERYSLHADIAALYTALKTRFNAEVDRQMRLRRPDPRFAVQIYAQLVVLRQMQINRGVKIPAHSLDWLRTLAEKLT